MLKAPAPASPASSHFQLRVYYEDTDFSGSVYHASYLRFLERGRTELLRERGVDQGALFAAAGSFFVVRAMTLDFLKPARMDDELLVETVIESLGGASLVMGQKIVRSGETLLTAKVKVALVAGSKPQRLPADLVAKLMVPNSFC